MNGETSPPSESGEAKNAGPEGAGNLFQNTGEDDTTPADKLDTSGDLQSELNGPTEVSEAKLTAQPQGSEEVSPATPEPTSPSERPPAAWDDDLSLETPREAEARASWRAYDRARIQATSERFTELFRELAAADNPERRAYIEHQITRLEAARQRTLDNVIQEERARIGVVDRAEGLYHLAVPDADRETRNLYGSSISLWHLGSISPSVFSIADSLRVEDLPPEAVPPETDVDWWMFIGGSSLQSRLQPFPADITLGTEILITAPDARDAGSALAQSIVNLVRRNADHPRLEFDSLNITAGEGEVRTPLWNSAALLDNSRRAELKEALIGMNGGEVHTSWYGLTDEGRYVEVTDVFSVYAGNQRVPGAFFSTGPGDTKLHTAYLDEVQWFLTDPSSLVRYAGTQRSKAIIFAYEGNALEAAMRASDYFRATGNLEGLEAVRPIFATEEARMNQHTADLEAIAHALDEGVQPSRILTVDLARDNVYKTAALIGPTLPAMAEKLQAVASDLHARRSAPDLVAPDELLHRNLVAVATEIRSYTNRQLADQVKPIIDRYVW